MTAADRGGAVDAALWSLTFMAVLMVAWGALRHFGGAPPSSDSIAANGAGGVVNGLRYSARDRDIMIRTVIGEAWHGLPSRRQPPLGMRAVAHVIVNRARDGRFGGRTLAAVCLAKYQFEPWIARGKALMRIHRTSDAYRSVARIVDAVLAGDADPTAGALFFLNPITVKKRRGGTLPRWAVGATLTVAAADARMIHVFYTGPKVAGWFRSIDDLIEKKIKKKGVL